MTIPGQRPHWGLCPKSHDGLRLGSTEWRFPSRGHNIREARRYDDVWFLAGAELQWQESLAAKVTPSGRLR